MLDNIVYIVYTMRVNNRVGKTKRRCFMLSAAEAIIVELGRDVADMDVIVEAAAVRLEVQGKRRGIEAECWRAMGDLIGSRKVLSLGHGKIKAAWC
jgi:hypothetical protein